MNFRTTYVIIAILALVTTISIAPTYAAHVPGLIAGGGNPSELANMQIMKDIPILITSDAETYDHDSTIFLEGHVSTIREGFQIALVVVSPLGNVVTIDQLEVDNDGTFSTTLNTGGNLWKYDGTYKISVQYGDSAISDRVYVELTGGIEQPTPTPPSARCNTDELSVGGGCVLFSISGGTVSSSWANTKDNSIVVSLSSFEPGTLTVSPSSDVIRGIFMVLVDGEEWDDVEIAGNDVTVMFPAGTEMIEIIGTFVIPEFGTIALMILAVAIISIIAVSAKTRLRVIPKL